MTSALPLPTQRPKTLAELCTPIFVFAFQLREAVGTDETAGDSFGDGDLTTSPGRKIGANGGKAGGANPLEKLGLGGGGGDSRGATKVRRKPMAALPSKQSDAIDDSELAFTSELHKGSMGLPEEDFSFSLELNKAAAETAKQFDDMGGSGSGLTNAEELEGEREAEALRLRIDTLFTELEAVALHANSAVNLPAEGQFNAVPTITPQDVQGAKFALVAYIDELIMGCPRPVGRVWANNPMQLEYFNDFNAGEQFFENLEELRGAANPRAHDVLEIYYLCLVLGFKGKFASRQGREKRKMLLDNLARELGTSRAQLTGGFAPSAMPTDVPPEPQATQSVWLVPGICAAVVFAVFVILSLILGGQASGFDQILAP